VGNGAAAAGLAGLGGARNDVPRGRAVMSVPVPKTRNLNPGTRNPRGTLTNNRLQAELEGLVTCCGSNPATLNPNRKHLQVDPSLPSAGAHRAETPSPPQRPSPVPPLPLFALLTSLPFPPVSSLEYEPPSEPLHISAKRLFLTPPIAGRRWSRQLKGCRTPPPPTSTPSGKPYTLTPKP